MHVLVGATWYICHGTLPFNLTDLQAWDECRVLLLHHPCDDVEADCQVRAVQHCLLVQVCQGL